MRAAGAPQALLLLTLAPARPAGSTIAGSAPTTRSGKPGLVYKLGMKNGKGNIDEYAPIYTPEEWKVDGDQYEPGLPGLAAWAATLGAVLLAGAFAIYTTRCANCQCERAALLARRDAWRSVADARSPLRSQRAVSASRGLEQQHSTRTCGGLTELVKRTRRQGLPRPACRLSSPRALSALRGTRAAFRAASRVRVAARKGVGR